MSVFFSLLTCSTRFHFLVSQVSKSNTLCIPVEDVKTMKSHHCGHYWKAYIFIFIYFLDIEHQNADCKNKQTFKTSIKNLTFHAKYHLINGFNQSLSVFISIAANNIQKGAKKAILTFQKSSVLDQDHTRNKLECA